MNLGISIVLLTVVWTQDPDFTTALDNNTGGE